MGAEIVKRKLLILCLLGPWLAACASDPVHFADIRPAWQVRNSPVPVPWPRAKPAAPAEAAVANASSGATAVHQVTVKRGDTVYGLARAHGMEPEELIAANDLSAPYTLLPGQTLTLPVVTEYTALAGEAASPRGFLWPLRGPIIARFGLQEGGIRNDGINIAADPGSPVRAAADGIVAYAGDALAGYGNLILVRHAGGFVTTYAHAADMLVAKGERVKKGQVIARAGATGGVRDTQLHFEIRQGRKAVDPLRLLAQAGAD